MPAATNCKHHLHWCKLVLQPAVVLTIQNAIPDAKSRIGCIAGAAQQCVIGQHLIADIAVRSSLGCMRTQGPPSVVGKTKMQQKYCCSDAVEDSPGAFSKLVDSALTGIGHYGLQLILYSGFTLAAPSLVPQVLERMSRDTSRRLGASAWVCTTCMSSDPLPPLRSTCQGPGYALNRAPAPPQHRQPRRQGSTGPKSTIGWPSTILLGDSRPALAVRRIALEIC